VQDYKSFPKLRKNAEADRKAEAEAIKKAQVADALQRLESLPVDYAPMKQYVSKSLSLLTGNQPIECSVCSSSSIEMPETTTVVCPMPDCNAISHIKCLATSFVQDATDGDLIPSTGSCPKCNTTLNWIDIARATSLRLRGAKDVAKIMRKPRQRKKKDKADEPLNGVAKDGRILDLEEDDQDTESEDDLENLDISGIVDEPLLEEAGRRGIFQDDDALSVTSEASDTSYIDTPKKPQFRMPKLPTVIEDSDCDDIEILL
jgi:structure-specific endonuclease subunit SLX1